MGVIFIIDKSNLGIVSLLEQFADKNTMCFFSGKINILFKKKKMSDAPKMYSFDQQFLECVNWPTYFYNSKVKNKTEVLYPSIKGANKYIVVS